MRRNFFDDRECENIGCFTEPIKNSQTFAFSKQVGEISYSNMPHPERKCWGNRIDIPDKLIFTGELSTDEPKRNIIFIAGSSGCGKTYMACDLIRNYTKVHDLPLKVFTQSDDTDCYAKFGLDPEIIPCNKKLLKKPYLQSDLQDSIVLFDDIDGIRNKAVRSEVFDLIERILKLGRKFNIQIVITYHLLTNYRETRYNLSECDYIIIFPNDGSINQFKRLFEGYIGIDIRALGEMRKARSRAVIIHNRMPKFYIAGSIIQSLNE